MHARRVATRLRFFLQIEEIEVEVLSSDRRDRGAEEGEGVGGSGSAARRCRGLPNPPGGWGLDDHNTCGDSDD